MDLCKRKVHSSDSFSSDQMKLRPISQALNTLSKLHHTGCPTHHLSRSMSLWGQNSKSSPTENVIFRMSDIFERGTFNLSKRPVKDHLYVVEKDLRTLNSNVSTLLSAEHSVLALMAKYYFQLDGKRLRPTVLLLMSKSLNETLSKSAETTPKQLKLAEILEFIHTGTLLHNNIVEESAGSAALGGLLNTNKIATLGGDFLLARASAGLADLENHLVTRLISTVLSDLVEAEFLQKQMNEDTLSVGGYMKKLQWSTASLFELGCQSSAILVDSSKEIVQAAGDFGRNFGYSFQLMDDAVAYENKLYNGLEGAPFYFALKDYPELTDLRRNFKQYENQDKARSLINKSGAVQKTKDLSRSHSQKALEALALFKDSKSKEALIHLTEFIVNRTE